jgi:hypothetical protein
MIACKQVTSRVQRGWHISTFVLRTQIEHPLTQQRHFVWFENPMVLRPLKETGLSSADERLFPRDCREGVRRALPLDGCTCGNSPAAEP